MGLLPGIEEAVETEDGKRILDRGRKRESDIENQGDKPGVSKKNGRSQG